MALDETCPSINTRIDNVVVSNAIWHGHGTRSPRTSHGDISGLLCRIIPTLRSCVELLSERQRHFRDGSGKGNQQFDSKNAHDNTLLSDTYQPL